VTSRAARIPRRLNSASNGRKNNQSEATHTLYSMYPLGAALDRPARGLSHAYMESAYALLRIGCFATVGSGFQARGIRPGARGHANPVMRNEPRTMVQPRDKRVYDYHLARTAQA